MKPSLELLRKWSAEQAQHPTAKEPELPEAVAQFNWNAGGFEWLTQYNYDKHHKKPLYTATQMHDHYQAGVRVGAARSQDGLSQAISGAIFDFAGFLTTRPNVVEVGSTANASPVADLVKEWAALRGLSLNDASVGAWQELLAMTAMQGVK